jgi:hypothetical protein
MIWCVTVASSGFSWSRFGPTVPWVPALASVWQPPQVVTNVAFADAGYEGVVVALVDVVEDELVAPVLADVVAGPPPVVAAGFTSVSVVPTFTVIGVEMVPALFDSKQPDASNATAMTGRTISEGRRRM